MKNLLVIGGSSGIGKAIVNRLKDEYNIIASYLENPLPEGVKGFQWNVLEPFPEDVELPDQIHGVVYAPGTINLKPFHGFREEDFIMDYRIQVLGAVKSIQKVLTQLKKAEHASIVLFSTVAVQKGFPFHSQVSASKGAIEGLTKALSAELAPKVRINAIAPSLTDTPLANQLLNSDKKRESNAKSNPMQRLGQPEDIAATAAFLLSDDASWITGQIIHVDGGMSTINK